MILATFDKWGPRQQIPYFNLLQDPGDPSVVLFVFDGLSWHDPETNLLKLERILKTKLEARFLQTPNRQEVRNAMMVFIDQELRSLLSIGRLRPEFGKWRLDCDAEDLL